MPGRRRVRNLAEKPPPSSGRDIFAPIHGMASRLDRGAPWSETGGERGVKAAGAPPGSMCNALAGNDMPLRTRCGHPLSAGSAVRADGRPASRRPIRRAEACRAPQAESPAAQATAIAARQTAGRRRPGAPALGGPDSGSPPEAGPAPALPRRLRVRALGAGGTRIVRPGRAVATGPPAAGRAGSCRRRRPNAGCATPSAGGSAHPGAASNGCPGLGGCGRSRGVFDSRKGLGLGRASCLDFRAYVRRSSIAVGSRHRQTGAFAEVSLTSPN